MIFNQISKSMGWPFTIVYLILVLSAFYFSFVTLPKAINTNNWSQVQGQVTQTELVERQHTLKTGKPITIYSAKIHYQYAIAGHHYNSHQLKWAAHHSQPVEQDMHSQHPVGASVTVFYNPQQPSESALQQGIDFNHTLIAAFLLVSILAMAFAMFKNARRRRR